MDIDIDLPSNIDIEDIFDDIIPASMVQDGELKKHPVGVYFQEIPVDVVTGLAAIPYGKAEDFEYYKIDMLHLHILKEFKSKEEMVELQKTDPDWSLLKDREVVEKLFHIGKHFDIVNAVKPHSLIQVADVIALIRPNKVKLLDKYLRSPDIIRKELFTKRDKTDMRKAHAIPYALIVILQLHLIKQGRM